MYRQIYYKAFRQNYSKVHLNVITRTWTKWEYSRIPLIVIIQKDSGKHYCNDIMIITVFKNSVNSYLPRFTGLHDDITITIFITRDRMFVYDKKALYVHTVYIKYVRSKYFTDDRFQYKTMTIHIL